MYWDQTATRLLIQLRMEFDPAFEANFGRRNNVWMELAARMAEAGYDFGIEKVSKKWHNILTTYNKNLQKMKEKGHVNWEYFDDMAAYVKTREAAAEFNTSGGHPQSDESNYSEDDDDDEVGAVSNAAAAASAAGAAADVVTKMERDVENGSPLLVPLESPANFHAAGSTLKRKSSASIGASKDESERKRVQPLRIVRKPLPDDDYSDDYAGFKDTGSAKTPKLPPKLLLPSSKSSGAHETDAADGDSEAAWTRQYFERKLQLQRDRLTIEQDRHRDYLSFQKMTLLLQEKMEKNKIEALRALTEAINRLI